MAFFKCDSCNRDLHGEIIHRFSTYYPAADQFADVTLCNDCKRLLNRDCLDVLANWVYVRDVLGIEVDG